MLIQRNFGVRAKKKTRGHKEERDLDRFEIQKLLRQILRALRDPGFFQSDSTSLPGQDTGQGLDVFR